MAPPGHTGDLFHTPDASADAPGAPQPGATQPGATQPEVGPGAPPDPDAAPANGHALDAASEDAADASEAADEDADAVATVEEGKLLDYISGEPVTDRPKEHVRQKTARALVHEFGIRPEDMETDVWVRLEVGGRSTRRKLELAVWNPGDPHELDTIRRVVVCKKPPSSKGTTKIKTHDQAQRDLRELEAYMAALDGCTYGLWTNGLDLFYLKKVETRFDTAFEPIGDWPPADESLEMEDVLSNARVRAAEPEMLKTTFRRCHNFIHGNEGMQKGKAFWQFLHLIFSKMYDEETNKRDQRQFWAGPTEQFTEAGRTAIRDRIEPLFEQAKAAYDTVFAGNERIELSDRALAFMVSELARYDFTRTRLDAKGTAYQEIVGSNLRGDRGQYFTPRGVVDMAVEMLDPKPTEVPV
jgi:type I restriction enzyme M protein